MTLTKLRESALPPSPFSLLPSADAASWSQASGKVQQAPDTQPPTSENSGSHTRAGVLPVVVSTTHFLEVRGNPPIWEQPALSSIPSEPSRVHYLSRGTISPPTRPAHTTMGVSEKTELTDSGSDSRR